MSAAPEMMPSGPAARLPHNPHALLVINTNSRWASAAKKAAEHYYSHGYAERDVDIVYTHPIRDMTRRLLNNALDQSSYDFVASLAGDGVTNTIASELVGTDTALYMGGFGSISDGHYTTVGEDELKQFSFQELTAMYPLETTVTHEAKSSKETALFYQGIGYTALSAELVNQPAHRGSFLMKSKPTKKVREGMTVIKALALNEPFCITDMATGEVHALHEYLISNGPRMAGMPVYPGDPTSQGFMEARLPNRLSPAKELLKLLVHNQGDWQPASHMTVRVMSMGMQQMVPLQFDGETRRLQTGSTVHTASSARPLYVVAPALNRSE